MGLLDQTYAAVVAIEHYPALGEKWQLRGIGAQAAKFVNWLINDRGLPPGQVAVFLSEADRAPFANLGIAEKQIEPAESVAINRFFAGLGGRWPNGRVLLIYWVGHGFVVRDRSRRLILSDAVPTLKTNLDMDQLVGLLRSPQAGQFRRQIAFIDTCATFFEELQSLTDLPPGGLNPGQPGRGITQNFYFAASSGQSATEGFFGPSVLDLLRTLPADEWPPDGRWMRTAIEEAFDRFATERLAEQQPAWLEYRDDLDNIRTRGVSPTLPDIHNLAQRAGFPVHYLRVLTELAAQCPQLAELGARDRLYAALKADRPLYRPAEAKNDLQLDLMRLIAGAIEQGLIEALVDQIIAIENNSDAASRFDGAARSVELVRAFWPLLVRVSLPLTRAHALYKAAHRLRASEHEPGSLAEIVYLLSTLGADDPLVEFLLRAAQEWRNPYCERLNSWLEAQPNWAGNLAKSRDRLDREAHRACHLLVAIGGDPNAWRVTRAWLWPAADDFPAELEALDPQGDLASDIAALRDLALRAGGELHIELLVPEELLHLERGLLLWKNRGVALDPERMHPVMLRWQGRMAADRDPGYQSGLWKRTGELIRQRLGSQRRAYWLERGRDIADFLKQFDKGEAGELIGIRLSSDGSNREELIGLICNAGLPFACWPRCATVDLKTVASSVDALLQKHQFDELPDALFKERGGDGQTLGDILLLWDDPQRNPYDPKYADVSQRGQL